MNGIGARLKLARKMARMGQRELAARVGVSAMAISKYERDMDMPGSEVLARLAEALGVRAEFLLRRAPALEIKPVFRKRRKLGTKAQQSVIAQIQEWLERYLAVESLLPPGEREAFRLPKTFPRRIETLEDVERAAEDLRNAWGLGNAPIENLTELLEDQGIKVGLVDGDDHFDACTFRVEGDGEAPVIAVKRDRPGDRVRFNLAHELGHLVLVPAAGVDEEKAAYRFAGAFLAPAAVMRHELGRVRSHLDPEELRLLKEKYGLSMAAWVYRAHDLGILNDAGARAMWQMFSQRGWRKAEPGGLPPERPRRMVRLVRRLVAEDVISRARAAELLGEPIALSLKQVDDVVDVRG